MVQLLAFRRSLRFIALATVFGVHRRIRHSGFSTASPWRRAACPRLSRRAPCAALHPSLPSAHERARRAGIAAWRRCRRAALPMPTQRFVDHDSTLTPPGGMAAPASFGSSNVGRRSAPAPRRQPDRPRQPVVRALHEHGAAAFRLSRHRLGHGEFVRAIRPARLRAAGRRHRRDGARPRRRSCRHHHRHRCDQEIRS